MMIGMFCSKHTEISPELTFQNLKRLGDSSKRCFEQALIQARLKCPELILAVEFDPSWILNGPRDDFEIL